MEPAGSWPAVGAILLIPLVLVSGQSCPSVRERDVYSYSIIAKKLKLLAVTVKPSGGELSGHRGLAEGSDVPKKGAEPVRFPGMELGVVVPVPLPFADFIFG